jgi:hypothetical protein
MAPLSGQKYLLASAPTLKVFYIWEVWRFLSVQWKKKTHKDTENGRRFPSDCEYFMPETTERISMKFGIRQKCRQNFS